MPKVEIRIERRNGRGALDVHIIGYDELTGAHFYSQPAEDVSDISDGCDRRPSQRRTIGKDKIRCIMCALLSHVPENLASDDDRLKVEVKAVQSGDAGIERTGVIFHDETGSLRVAIRIVGTDHVYEAMAIGYGDVKCFLCTVFATGQIPGLSGGFGSCADLCRPGCHGLPYLQKKKAPS